MTEKIKLTILPTGAMHADLTWLLISPAKMASRSQPVKQKDWVEVPTHCVYIEHPSGAKLLWDAGVPRDWETRWAPSGLGEFFPVDAATEEMWLDSRLRQLEVEPSDIDYLLLSHLHLDHAANAKLFQDSGTKIIVDEEEKKGGVLLRRPQPRRAHQERLRHAHPRHHRRGHRDPARHHAAAHPPATPGER